MRRTKIVCTLGPATDENNRLEELFTHGMNVARLNFSHGSHEEHKKRVLAVKALRNSLSIPAAILLDTKGPEIRVKNFLKDHVTLKDGDSFILTTREIEGTDESVSVTYKGLPENVERGDRILIDDGLIELRVISKNTTDVECTVVSGGPVSNHKGINLPGITVALPFMSEHDKEDIMFAIENKLEYIAASFTRSAEDIRELRNFLNEHRGQHIKIIAKIENRDGVNNIDEIIQVSDGAMVARGDMGVEIPFEELPHIQKDIIKKCNFAGKPVITATQMLDSMIRNPRPTRAEITDVANAIYDGTSAIMLSGETAIGKYPLEAVRTMTKIAEETEKNINYIERFNHTHNQVPHNVTSAICHATCGTAHSLGASGIITVTKSGHTAQMVSRFRPAPPIVAATISERVLNQLSLSWGVYPILTKKMDSTDQIFTQAIDKSMETDIIKTGDLVVITGGMLADMSGTTNTLKVHIAGDVLLEGKGTNNHTATGIVCVIKDTKNNTSNFSAGNVLVINRVTDEILKIIKNTSAIITEEDDTESRAVIIGQALELPVIINAPDATERLKSGTMVTVNAKEGRVYSAPVQKNLN